MKYELENKPNCVADLNIEVAGDEYKKHRANVYEKIQKMVKVPGFRAGMVPNSVIDEKFADAFREELVEEILRKNYGNIVEENKIRVIGDPEVTDINVTADSINISLRLMLIPSFELPKYEGLNVTLGKVEVSDEAVENQIAEMAKNYAEFKKSEEGAVAKKGNIVAVNYDGTIDGEKLPGLAATGAFITLGEGKFLKDFEDGFLGHKVGDTFAVEVKFPADYMKQSYANKTAIFQCSLNDMFDMVIPGLDDDLAKNAGYETLEEFKNVMRDHIFNNQKSQVESKAVEEIFAHIKKGLNFELPSILIDTEVLTKRADLDKFLAEKMLTLDEFLAFKKMTEAELLDSYRQEALDGIKEVLVMQKIAEQEKISISREEVASVLKELKVNPKNRNKLEELVMEVEHNLLFRKVKQLLLEKNTKK